MIRYYQKYHSELEVKLLHYVWPDIQLFMFGRESSVRLVRERINPDGKTFRV